MAGVWIGITLAAFAAAGVFAALGWRLLRADREGTAMRAAELAALAAADDDSIVALEDVDASDPAAAVTIAAPRMLAAPAAFAVPHTIVAPGQTPIRDAVALRVPDARDVPLLFTEPARTGRPHLALAAFLVAMIVLGGSAVYGLGVAADRFGASHAGVVTPGVPPLELLSLRHDTADDGSFVVTGLVQNPAAGADLHDLQAVVYLFDRQGTYLSGGHATVEFTTLHPGDQSSFVVRIAHTTDVARYRVGFRTDAGTVAHVDRRGTAPGGMSAASASAQNGSH